MALHVNRGWNGHTHRSSFSIESVVVFWGPLGLVWSRSAQRVRALRVAARGPLLSCGMNFAAWLGVEVKIGAKYKSLPDRVVNSLQNAEGVGRGHLGRGRRS